MPVGNGKTQMFFQGFSGDYTLIVPGKVSDTDNSSDELQKIEELFTVTELNSIKQKKGIDWRINSQIQLSNIQITSLKSFGATIAENFILNEH